VPDRVGDGLLCDAVEMGRCSRGAVAATSTISRTKSTPKLVHSAKKTPGDTVAKLGRLGQRCWKASPESDP
jgi:hypothetical protein